MIERISELPFWGPEEQIRKFVNQHDQPDSTGSLFIGENEVTQEFLSQQRIENLDDIFQKQLIWSYGKPAGDAYFYWDWCPEGTGEEGDPKWRISTWSEYPYNLGRTTNDRSFKYTEFKGVTNTTSNADEMPKEYDGTGEGHAEDHSDLDDPTTLDIDTLRHNIMLSYLEVSEWLGDGSTEYGSHNGFVSRKMSMAWLFDAIRALINWKLNNQDKWAEVDITPLDVKNFEGFLDSGQSSPCDVAYDDYKDLTQADGRCAKQYKVRSSKPNVNGTLKVRGNEFHYGERADFYTHNSFIGECRFFHNARFLGQTTFDKEINGTAMRSRWADLAEFKEADKEYEPGTLVMFGGEKEITLARKGKANAIVTTKPGLTLNGDNYPGKIMVGITLTGTVPVRIVGRVKKFDRLVADPKYPGYARKRRWYEFWKKPIAIALESFPAGGIINCMTKMEF